MKREKREREKEKREKRKISDFWFQVLSRQTSKQINS